MMTDRQHPIYTIRIYMKSWVFKINIVAFGI